MERCPSCNRVFKYITDFPKIHILEFLRINPDDIPKIIYGTKAESLFAETEYKEARVPNNVLKYFKQNPDKPEMVTSKYIYTFHPNDGSGRSRDIYRRQLNFTTIIKKLLLDNHSLKRYFSKLERIVGKTITPSTLFPNWERTHQMGSINFSSYIIPESKLDTKILNIDNYNQLVLGFSEDEENRRNNYRGCNVEVFYGGGNSMRSTEIGHIKYKGVLQNNQ